MPAYADPAAWTNTNSWREELAWAAGFFDGEGCIPKTRWPKLYLVQAELEPLHRFQEAVLGLGRIKERNPRRNHLGKKKLWDWEIGKYEEIQAVLAMLWPFLSSRRSNVAYDLLLKQKTLKQLIIQKRNFSCQNGHIRTLENTRHVKSKNRNQTQLCLDCAKARQAAFRLRQAEKR